MRHINRSLLAPLPLLLACALYAAPCPAQNEDQEGAAASDESSAPASEESSSENQPQEKASANICRLLGEDETLAACPNPVWRGNSYDSYDLNAGVVYNAYIDTDMIGARADPGKGTVPIHAFNKCYFIDNNSNSAFFIPFRSDQEWSAFIERHPPTIALRACTVHGVYTSVSATSRGDHATFSLPAYATAEAVETFTQSFGYLERERCDKDEKNCIGPWEWDETIQASFKATPPGWTVLNESLIGKPPEIP